MVFCGIAMLNLSLLVDMSCGALQRSFDFFFLVGYVEERLWWPIQSPNIGGKKKAISSEDREIRSSVNYVAHYICCLFNKSLLLIGAVELAVVKLFIDKRENDGLGCFISLAKDS